MTAPTTSNPRTAALQGRASSASTAAVVAILTNLFGPTMTARIADVTDVTAIDKWTTGQAEPDTLIAYRLRMTLSFADILLEHETPTIVRTWFGGRNRMLGDVSPASAVGTDPDAVWQAARAFRAYG